MLSSGRVGKSLACIGLGEASAESAEGLRGGGGPA